MEQEFLHNKFVRMVDAAYKLLHSYQKMWQRVFFNSLGIVSNRLIARSLRLLCKMSRVILNPKE